MQYNTRDTHLVRCDREMNKTETLCGNQQVKSTTLHSSYITVFSDYPFSVFFFYFPGLSRENRNNPFKNGAKKPKCSPWKPPEIIISSFFQTYHRYGDSEIELYHIGLNKCLENKISETVSNPIGRFSATILFRSKAKVKSI